MDLYAYMNIGSLDELAKRNGIEVPRLRGYRLMAQEEHLSTSDLEKLIHADAIWECERWCCSHFYDHDFIEFSPRTDNVRKKYMISKDGSFAEIRWNRIHGKRRKRLKYAIKKRRQRVLKQYEVFNKYAGREDVLYIHARIGGNNWDAFNGSELKKQPWFLEKVDDHFDETYCDIYARISNNASLEHDQHSS